MNRSALLAASVAAASATAASLSSSAKLSLQVFSLNSIVLLFFAVILFQNVGSETFLTKKMFFFSRWDWNARLGFAGRWGSERPRRILAGGEFGVNGEVRAAVRRVAVHWNADYCAQMNARCSNALLGFFFTLIFFDLALSRKLRKIKNVGDVLIFFLMMFCHLGFWVEEWRENCNITGLLLLL